MAESVDVEGDPEGGDVEKSASFGGSDVAVKARGLLKGSIDTNVVEA